MAYSPSVKKRARELRKQGYTHREISREVGVQISTVHLWTAGIVLTAAQKQAVEFRRNRHAMNEEERRIVARRLAPFRTEYSAQEWLQKIRDFHAANGRIPLKREFNSWHTFAKKFGGWNKAIRAAGFEPNPVLFAKKFIANDGHSCDSFSEKIIDDWLYANHIPHERNVRYGTTKFTADFKIASTLIEFFGLAGEQDHYDRNIEKKRELSKELGFELVEIYPCDLYPQNKLSSLIRR